MLGSDEALGSRTLRPSAEGARGSRELGLEERGSEESALGRCCCDAAC